MRNNTKRAIILLLLVFTHCGSGQKLESTQSTTMPTGNMTLTHAQINEFITNTQSLSGAITVPSLLASMTVLSLATQQSIEVLAQALEAQLKIECHSFQDCSLVKKQ